MRDTNVIPQDSGPGSDPVKMADESPWHDYCRFLLHRLSYWKPQGASSYVLGVTSCAAGAGVTSLISHLASTTAGDTGQSVLLVDANLDDPLLHQLFDVPPRPGLVDLLLRGALPGDAIRDCCIPRLSVLPAGKLEGSSARAYASLNLPAVINGLRNEHELILVDLPPLDTTASAARIAGLLDGVVLVVEAERDETETAQYAQDLLIQAQARLLGVVLNKRQANAPQWSSGGA